MDDATQLGHINGIEQSVTFPDRDFEHLFHSQYNQLVRSLTAITGNREMAQDCVQDAFIKLGARWHKIRRYDKPAAWVRRVAITRSREIVRANERRLRRERRAASAVTSSTIEDSQLIDESLTLVQLFNQLPARQRTTAALFYLGDLSIADIADTLGISRGTVRFHLSQARASLRTALERAEHCDEI